MKIVERVMKSIIRSSLNINKMQYGSIPGHGAIDAMFFLWQRNKKKKNKKKKRRKHKPLYFAFVDRKKAFNRVPRKVIWWAMRRLGIIQWKIKFEQAMYAHAASNVWINNTFSEKFSVKVGVHQGSVLSPLLFVIVMKWLSQDCRRGCPWELLYSDDLVIMIMDESIDGLLNQFSAWKYSFDAKRWLGLTCPRPKYF